MDRFSDLFGTSSGDDAMNRLNAMKEKSALEQDKELFYTALSLACAAQASTPAEAKQLRIQYISRARQRLKK